ncbi:MAG TPA: hypothetical protein VMM36_12365 [Opitutaceae bacterium]|nr:hypothetical protein [Opitutaceae bacterium]
MKRSTTIGLIAVVMVVAVIILIQSNRQGPSAADGTPQRSLQGRVGPAPQETPLPPIVEVFEADSMRPGAKVDLLVVGEESYRGLTIANITSENVTLRDDRNIVSIPMNSLPENVREMAGAYLTGTGAGGNAREGGPAFPANGPQYHDATGYRLLPPTAVLDRDSATARKAARDRTESWLRLERPPGPNDIVPLVTWIDMETPMPLAGAQGKWRVRGRGYVATTHAETGGEFRNFEVIVSLDREGKVLGTELKVF